MMFQLKHREMAMLNPVMDVLLVHVKVVGMVGGMAADGMMQWKHRETAMQHTIMVVFLVHLKVDGMVGGMMVDGMVQWSLFVILHNLGKGEINGIKMIGTIHGLMTNKTLRGGEETEWTGVVLVRGVQLDGTSGDGVMKVMNVDEEAGIESSHVFLMETHKPLAEEVHRILPIGRLRRGRVLLRGRGIHKGMFLGMLRRQVPLILCLHRSLLQAPPHPTTIVGTVNIHKGSGGMGCGTAEAALSRKNVITVVDKDQYDNRGGRGV
ncbi:unnamed protein product [Symbiodinium sp. CCMP2456]|nr:unnamed protein product [Symbiodinium sp. CCMP2456]